MKHVTLAALSFAAIAWPRFPPPQRDALHAIVIAQPMATLLPPEMLPLPPDGNFP